MTLIQLMNNHPFFVTALLAMGITSVVVLIVLIYALVKSSKDGTDVMTVIDDMLFKDWD